MFIGIDHSITETGVTILFSPTKYKSFSFKGKGRSSLERMLSIRNEVSKLVHTSIEAYTKMGKDASSVHASIEGGAFDAGGRLYTLGQLSGLLIGVLAGHGINVTEVPPSSAKKYISGKGNATKKLVIDAIYARYGIRFTNDNLADSYVMALVAYDMAHASTRHRSEMEVVDKLKRKAGGEKVGKKRGRYRRKKTEF